MVEGIKRSLFKAVTAAVLTAVTIAIADDAPAFIPRVQAEPKEEAEAGAAPGVAKVAAVYDIRFNGLGIGQFKLWSNMTSRQYTLSAQANVSLLAGMLFDWKGVTSSSGLVTAKGPMPAKYSFGYATSDKKEQIELRFVQNAVSQVVMNPPQRPSSRRVPLAQHHMQNVVDPLSAVILLSRNRHKKQGKEVCERRLPIFDGKMRYDIELSYKSTKQVNNGGYKGPAYVCRIKYIPIAGHKHGKNQDDVMSGNLSMEIWLIPVPDASLYVPYYVSIPTPAGNASIISTRFEIETPSHGRRALLE